MSTYPDDEVCKHDEPVGQCDNCDAEAEMLRED